MSVWCAPSHVRRSADPPPPFVRGVWPIDRSTRSPNAGSMDGPTRPPERSARCPTRHTCSPATRWPPALSTRSIGAITTTRARRRATPTGSRSSISADGPLPSVTTVAETPASFPNATPTGWLPPTATRPPGRGAPRSSHGWREPCYALGITASGRRRRPKEPPDVGHHPVTRTARSGHPAMAAASMMTLTTALGWETMTSWADLTVRISAPARCAMKCWPLGRRHHGRGVAVLVGGDTDPPTPTRGPRRRSGPPSGELVEWAPPGRTPCPEQARG